MQVTAGGLQNKQTNQLATATSFYMTAKIHEPVQLGIDMLIKLCRGIMKESSLVATEQDILCSLDWCVCISTTALLEYVMQFLELLLEWMDVADGILGNAMEHMDCATTNMYFSTYGASVVGVAYLTGALDDIYVLSSLERSYGFS